MSVYETSITNPKKQLEFYKQLSEQLQQENAELKTKIKKYEDPEDLTLMFMYCDEKARDKIKELKAKLELYENGVYYSSENDKLSKEVDMWFSKYKEIIGDVEDE